MVSLRARLLVSLLALSAVGLLLLGGITYAEQRSFLMDRVDQQVRLAPMAVQAPLGGGQPGGQPGPGGGAGGAGIGGPIPQEPDHDDRRPGRGQGPAAGLPPGTWGEQLDGQGALVAGPIVLSYAATGIRWVSTTTSAAGPALPSPLPVGQIFSADGQNGADTDYRVLATRSPAGVTVAAVPLRDVDQTLDRLLLVEGLVIAGVLLLLGVAGWLVVRAGLKPLDRMGHTAGAIAGGDLSHRVSSTDPRSEVGRLGIALNAMLDRLERAFSQRRQSEDRLRQFIADASHELRTPLASIRGYAELFRIGAASSPEDVDKAMRRIEEEAARMGVLVEDLLTLARLDEVRDAERSPVDLVALVRDAVDDARATAPDRSLTTDLPAAATTLGDADQLRQVLANLLRNALVHTPDGTPIEVTVKRDASQVSIEVRDHGPGLPMDDPNVLFERFWRAEGGRQRGRGGSGLGLAIVAGIVDAHGGRIEAGNADGGGAAFVVILPVA